MKKILILIAAVTLTGAVSAQRVQLGVRAGLFSQDLELTNINDIMTDAKLGYHVAVVSRIRLAAVGSGALGMGFYLQPEVVYSQNNYKMQVRKVDDTRSTSKIRMQSVEIPVLVSFKLSVARVYAGPVFNAMYRTDRRKGDADLMSMKPTTGYAVGLSFDLFGGLVLDGRYNGQFKQLKNSIHSGDTVYDSVKGSLSSWAIGVSWLF